MKDFKAYSYNRPNKIRPLNYRLFVPETDEGDLYPLILILHQYGNNGSDNKKQVDGLVYEWASSQNQKNFPCYILAPQCPIGLEWADKGPMSMPYRHYTQDKQEETEEMKMIVEVILNAIHTYNIDKNKIYVVGFSMGATGCWDILTRHPDLFAASVIASGVSDLTKADQLKEIPIWVFSGEHDNIAPAKLNINMVANINKNGGKAKLTLLKGEGHNIGAIAYQYPDVKEWLFMQSKLNKKVPPE
ncbi:prolyl oligopeptidase family serine peptidase [Saccharicrinis sp. GN24d3]